MDQAARRAPTFPQAQKEVLTLLRQALPHYRWLGVYLEGGGELRLHTQEGQGAPPETLAPDDLPGPAFQAWAPILWGGRRVGLLAVSGGACSGADDLVLEAAARLLAFRWAAEHESPALAADTRAVLGPGPPEWGLRPVSEAVYHSATYAFPDTRAIEEYLADQDKGYIYTRYGNPTVRAVEETLAALEGAQETVLFASGMAAIASTLLSLLGAGDEVLACHSIYGGAYHLLHDILPRYGIGVRFLGLEEMRNPAAFLGERTRLVYFEPLTNPMLRVLDPRPIAAACRARGILTAVDNTLASPVFLRPLEMGIDLVLHSATKYLGGHSDLLAGAVSGARHLVGRIRLDARYLGTPLNPPEAMLLARGLKTLALRVRRQNETALTLARWLAGRPEVERVWHPGLPDHPDHSLAREILGGTGGLVTFQTRSYQEACRIVDRLTLFRRAASLGGVESLVSMPVLASHWNVPPEGLERAGITPGTVRLSVGVEDPDDLIADLERALEQGPGSRSE
jgi:cystathionine beta-lyase/cystathionine gamma-synthase